MKISFPLTMLALSVSSMAYADYGASQLEHGTEHRVHSALSKPRVATEVFEAKSKSETATINAACTPAEFAAASGEALINLVKLAEVSCLNQLYDIKGTAARDTFNEAKMVTVANAFKKSAENYPGNNNEKSHQLITFLRAGYFVQYYNANDVGTYGSALKSAIQGAFDTFFASARAFDETAENGRILSETITAVDSATENARYANKLAAFLNNTSSNSFTRSEVRAAINSVFTVAFRGHQNDDFKALVARDNTFFDALYHFEKNWRGDLIGGGNAYLVINAARESSRFLRYDGALKTLARERTKEMINAAPAQGNTLSLWAALADMADYFDASNCSFYGICNWERTLADSVLSIQHTCSPTIRIRAQEMTSTQLAESCTKLTAQESYFHARLETNNIPIPGDLNDDLEIVVFNSSSDYQNYAGTLFGISTNNGGMYLEGNPERADNQARFIAYERTWRLPGESTLPFAIWNLEHEYVHYLDGRFDMKGGFSDGQRAKTVWWGEGLAQYIALKNDYPNAIELARTTSPVALSTIFQNDYNSGSQRVYEWGYLAVRFMFEKHMDDVRAILTHMRAGDYTGAYTSYMNNISNKYDAEFRTWLGTLGSGGGNTAPVVNAGVDQVVVSARTVTLAGTATDNDSNLTYAWTQTKGAAVTLRDANKATASFVAPTVTVSTDLEFELRVTDSGGLFSTDRVNVRVDKSGSAPQVNAGADQSVDINAWVTLSGSATDADGGNLRYQWLQRSGPTVTLDNAAMASTRFLAPAVNVDTDFDFELTVTDDSGMQSADTVHIRVKKAAVEQAPEADAGSDQQVMSAAAVTLRGRATDADSNALTYRWIQLSGPTVTLNNAMTDTASFTAPVVTSDTELQFELTVTDNTNLSSKDGVRVLVQKNSNGNGDNNNDDDSSGGGSVSLFGFGLFAALLGHRARRRVMSCK